MADQPEEPTYSERVMFRVSPEIKAKLEECAKKDMRSLSSYVRRLVLTALECDNGQKKS